MFSNAVRLGASLERAMDVPIENIPHWTESKQRQREALKKLAHGQKPESGQGYSDFDF